jgi:hypothetical protein
LVRRGDPLNASRARVLALLSNVDHLVYATPDLELGIGEVEHLLGIRATHGGQHPGRGTRNALIAFGPAVYLEIIDSLERSKLVTWAAKTDDIDRLHRVAAANRIPIGEVRSGSRRRSDGALLSWRLTEPTRDMKNGIIPFFIDWGASPHPSRTATQGAMLAELRAEHPDSERMRRSLEMLGLQMTVMPGIQASLIAIVDGARGRVELR